MPEVSQTLQEELNNLIQKRKGEAVRLSSSCKVQDIYGRRNVVDLRGSNEESIVRVGTDCAGFVSPEREIVTEDLAGCMGLFIKGKNGNALIHLTPSSKLGYSSPGEKIGSQMNDHNYLTPTFEKLMPSIQQLGSPDELEVVILANFMEEDRPELQKISEMLNKNGITKIKTELIPLDRTFIAYLPKTDPNNLIVVGNKVYFPEDSKYLHRSPECKEETIPIDAKTGQTLIIPQKPVSKKSVEAIQDATRTTLDDIDL